MVRNLFLTFLLIAGSVSATLAQSTTSPVFRFLNLPVTARSAALGGNHISLNDGDVSLFQLNPAYLDTPSHRNLAISYINHLSDVNLGFISGAWSLNNIGTVGGGLRYVNYGQFNRTGPDGEDMGTFHANDIALDVGIGRRYNAHFRYGASISFIYSGYDSYQSTGIGLTVGGLYWFPDQHLSLGAVIKNIGYQTGTYDGLREPLPLDIGLGISKKLEHTPLRLSILFHKLNNWDLRTYGDEGSPNFKDNFFRHLVVGTEFILSSHVQLRFGYDYYQHEQLKTGSRLDTAGFSFGLSIMVKKYRFGFSRNSYSALGGLTQFSFQTNI